MIQYRIEILDCEVGRLVTEAKKRSNAKWDKENMTMLGCKARKTKADEFKAVCRIIGTTPNEVFRRAMDKVLEDYHNKEA